MYDWKSELAKEVFDWMCFALEQNAEENAKYWSDKDRPPAEFCRAVGWNEAIRIVTKAFTRDGFVGTCLTLAADVDGPVGSSASLSSGEWIDTTDEFFHTQQPFDVLNTLREQLKKAHWQYASQLPGKQHFHGAPGAIKCAIGDITRIMQDICVHEPDNNNPNYGRGEPEVYMPDYYYYTCKKCQAEVMAVVEIDGSGKLVEPSYTGEWDD